MNKDRLRDLLRPYYFRWYEWPRIERIHNALIQNIRQRGQANVVFFACDLSMWHLQEIYKLFSQDKRFNTYIILRPLINYSIQQREKNIALLREHFDYHGIPYIDASKWEGEQCNLMTTIKPDIMFYPQHYWYMFGCLLDSEHYFSRLLCYLPYAANTISENWSLNSSFLNRAWKLLYETEYNKAEAQRIMYNRGKNVVVAGNADADTFIGNDHRDVWKPQALPKKRIIWAPHWTIESTTELNRGGFLWLNKFMLDVARKYKDKLQIAFKPHPRLRSALYTFPEWGQERTDFYYSEWQNLENGQLEEGSYANLFMTSDAMIHDCGSFTVQYHYSKQPVLFTSQSFDRTRNHLNALGQAAINAHYIGKDTKDVEHFIIHTVLEGNDPKKAERLAFYNEYLMPSNGNSVALNVYNDIVSSLFPK